MWTRASARPAPLSLLLALAACGQEGPTAPDGARYEALELEVFLLRGSLYVGDSVPISVHAVTTDGRKRAVSVDALTSSDPGAADFLPLNYLKGLRLGRTTITATLGSLTATLPVEIQGILHTSHITESTVWTVADAPHVVVPYLEVGGPSPVTLTIEAGASVYFRDGGGLQVGFVGDGHLIAGGSATTTLFEHEDPEADPDDWRGLQFYGNGSSELVNVVVHRCGAEIVGWPYSSCVGLRTYPDLGDPTVLLKDVTVTEGVGFGVVVEPGARFAEGSTRLTVDGIEGSYGFVSVAELPRFPYGGRLAGATSPRILLFGDTLAEDTEWRDAGVPWLLVGDLVVAGPDAPVLTLLPGARVQVDTPSRILVGDGAPGGLRVGGPGGPTVVLEEGVFQGGGGWGGIYFLSEALPSSLVRVEMRDCGFAFAIVCLAVLGDGAGNAPVVLVDEVRIQDAVAHGVRLEGGGRFDPLSRALTVVGANGRPIVTSLDAVSSLPAGSYVGNGTDRIQVGWEVLTSDHLWSDLGVPYEMTGGLALEHESAPTLTLAAGVRLLFVPGAYLFVGRLGPGSMRALGSADRPVVFGSTLEAPFPGSWGGISVEAAAGANTLFEHVIIENAGPPGGPEVGGIGGAIVFATDLGPVLRSSLVRRSGTCAILRGPGAAWVTDFTDPALENTFEANEGADQCGG
jgi:hypothetical protein